MPKVSRVLLTISLAWLRLRGANERPVSSRGRAAAYAICAPVTGENAQAGQDRAPASRPALISLWESAYVTDVIPILAKGCATTLIAGRKPLIRGSFAFVDIHVEHVILS